MAQLVVTMKDGEVKRFQASSSKGAHEVIALCVGVYHYLPAPEGRINLEDIEELSVEEERN